MPKAQLPLLTSTIMIVQAVVAAPAGIRAKGSIKARNQVLLLGYAAMIAADLAFAFLGSVPGEGITPLSMIESLLWHLVPRQPCTSADQVAQQDCLTNTAEESCKAIFVLLSRNFTLALWLRLQLLKRTRDLDPLFVEWGPSSAFYISPIVQD